MHNLDSPPCPVTLFTVTYTPLSQSELTNDPRLTTLSGLQVPLWVFDTALMRVVWANSAGVHFWGANNADELYGRDMASDLSDVARTRLGHLVTDCYQRDSVLKEIWTLYPTGLPPRTGEVALSAFPVADRQQALLVEVVRNISETSAETLHSITALNHTASMISLYDERYRLLYSNASARHVLRKRSNALIDMLVNDSDLYHIEVAVEKHESCTIELEVNTIEGPRWHSMIIRRTLDALTGNTAILVSAIDATEKRLAQQAAYKLAYTDSLTGLPNRAALEIYMNELLSEEDSQSAKFGLFFLDLDRFKAINDSLGHAIGDLLLIEVALRLKKSVGANGMVSRLGGDEFIVIISGQTEVNQLSSIAQKILSDMAMPVKLDKHELRISPSMGICRYPDDGQNGSELLEHADAAMYLAKGHQSGFCFFDEKLTHNLSETVKNRLALESDLVTAISGQQFELYYQPKISCRSLSVIGVEALIRWNHPVRGQVSPDDFIAIAEETGQIIQIGNWVMDTAMRQQRRWHDRGLMIPVAINISPRQFEDDELLANVSECLVRNRCDSKMIELEITESMLLGDAEKTQTTLHQLSAMGIKLALDDFGTGYSNLAYLQKYPLDTLKIDRVFLADQTRSMLLGTILDMGKVLGLKIVAEGVETASQADWLIANGCDQLQGFYFSKPLPAKDAENYLIEQGAGKRTSQGKAA